MMPLNAVTAESLLRATNMGNNRVATADAQLHAILASRQKAHFSLALTCSSTTLSTTTTTSTAEKSSQKAVGRIRAATNALNNNLRALVPPSLPLLSS